MATFTKKTWKDRKTEYPNRRLLTKENGSTELVTVSREEGTISAEGDAFSAASMNDLETRIQKAIGSGTIPTDLGTDIISALTKLNTDVGNKCFFTAGTCEKTLIKGSSIRCDCLTVPDDGVYLFLGGIDFSESADAIMVSQFCVNGATAYIGFRQNASGGGGDANFMVRQAVKGQLVGFLITSTASSTTIKARCSIYAIRLS